MKQVYLGQSLSVSLECYFSQLALENLFYSSSFDCAERLEETFK